MKKSVLIFFFANIALTNTGKAQRPPNDTIVQLNSLIANKAFYIGKNFSVLRDSLDFQIKYFFPERHRAHDISKETHTAIGFYFPNTSDEMSLAYPMLRIAWQSPLNADQSIILFRNNNAGQWTPTVDAFYSSAVIADFWISDL